MQLADRIEIYREIEAFRERPLVVYATSTRPGAAGKMAADAVREFIDQIDEAPESKAIDILLHSTGGDALTAWKLMSLLRERFDKVSVLVPNMAFSAATIFALGADEIVMHPHASLGPIDPQVTITTPEGKQRQFSYEDVGAFLRFLAEEVKVSEQIHLSAIIEQLFTVVDPVSIGGAKRASELSTTVGERLLRTHMKKPEEETRAKEIAENLNRSFFAHGDAVSRSRAVDLGLKVAKPDKKLFKLIWRAYLALEEYLKLREPFQAVQHYLRDPDAAKALRPTSPLQLPPNAPAQLVQQAWEAAANKALQAAQQPGVEVDYAIVWAVIESVRVASEMRTEGKLTGFRTPTGEIQVAGVDLEGRWFVIDVPLEEAAVSGSPEQQAASPLKPDSAANGEGEPE